MKKAIIIGAGPAGLAAAYELLENTDYIPLILEREDIIGGIACTIDYKGNKMDMGGHRFFSKSETINNWWNKFLAPQGAPAIDDILLNRKVEISTSSNALAPEKADNVFLTRPRFSHIYYLRQFFDYPVSLNFNTIKGLGLIKMTKIGFFYLKALAFPKKEITLEDFFINRFGFELYSTFFKDYTEKLWGLPCSEISAAWGAQRIKGISIIGIIKDIFGKLLHLKNRKVETSLIESFSYPKFGPGQLWNNVAEAIIKKGGEIRLNQQVTDIEMENNHIIAVTSLDEHGQTERHTADVFFSTMPIRELVAAMPKEQVPAEIRETAKGLTYRDFRVAGLLLKELKIKNTTATPTINKLITDTWVYVQEKDVKIGRIQIFNNWSPYLVKDFPNKIWIGLEYFCTEGDELWNALNDDFIAMAIREAEKIGFITKENVLDACTHKIRKAYPAYFGSYENFPAVKDYLNTIDNLYLIGRNGMHRYNNMDHSILTAITAVNNLKQGITTRDNIWDINTEQEYHEEKK